MNPTERRAVLTIALPAAFAGGRDGDAGRDAVRRVMESRGGEISAAALYQDVLLKRATLASLPPTIPA